MGAHDAWPAAAAAARARTQLEDLAHAGVQYPRQINKYIPLNAVERLAKLDRLH